MYKEGHTMCQNQQNSKIPFIILAYKSSTNFLDTAVNSKAHTHTHTYTHTRVCIPLHFLNGLPETRPRNKCKVSN